MEIPDYIIIIIDFFVNIKFQIMLKKILLTDIQENQELENLIKTLLKFVDGLRNQL